jgi:glycosyltransferase involved in cell wall biosynthesis
MDKFDVVPYPLDDDDFIKDSTSVGDIVSHHGPLIGKIGRPSPSKWGDLLIPAFSKALSIIDSLKLFLVGAPSKIKEQVKNLGVEDHVIYREQLPPDEVTKFYKNIDLLTHSSAIGESFGYVIAESLAAGTPVIVNSTPMQDNAQIELVDNSVNGFVANSPSAFSKAIVKLLSNPQLFEAFSKNGVRKMRNEYHISNIIDRIEKDYIEIYNDKAVTSSERKSGYEYNDQLNDHISGCDPKYMLEKQLWNTISKAPLCRKQLIYRLTSKAVRSFTR